MLKVAIYTDKDKEGYVSYTELDHKVIVTHPDEAIRTKIYEFLTTEHKFRIAGEERGQYAYFYLPPDNDVHHLQLALSEMFVNTGVM